MTTQKLQTWNKLQILEAAVVLKDILEAQDCSEETTEQLQFFAEDLIDVLEGRISPIPNQPLREDPIIFNADFSPPANAKARDFIMTPGVGFVPVLGQINVDEQSVTWYTDDVPERDVFGVPYNQDDEEQDIEPELTEADAEYCPRCKAYTAYPDVDGDICCGDCCTVIRWVSREAA